MTARLRLTAAAAAAIAHDLNVGTERVLFTRIALGSGTGAGDQSARAALTTQRDVEAATGSTLANRISLRADYMPTESYAVTEIGVLARIGEGEEFLAAYWTAEDAAGAVAAAAIGTSLVIVGVVEIQDASADIAVTPAVNISVGVPADVVRQSQHATVDQRGIIELATLIEGRAFTDAERAITALVLGGVLADYGTREWVRQQIAALVGGAPAQLDTLNELAAALNNRANLAVELNALIARCVLRAGDTMTGPLNLPTPDDGDDSKKAVNSEWVRDFLERARPEAATRISGRPRSAAAALALFSSLPVGVVLASGWTYFGNSSHAVTAVHKVSADEVRIYCINGRDSKRGESMEARMQSSNPLIAGYKFGHRSSNQVTAGGARFDTTTVEVNIYVPR